MGTTRKPRKSAIGEDWNFVELCVGRLGGVEKAAKKIRTPKRDVERYMRRGTCPEEIAKRLGYHAKVYWPHVAYGAR